MVYAPITLCAAPSIVGTMPANTINPANVRPKVALNPMPTSSTTTVLSAMNTWDPFAVACIQIMEVAEFFAALFRHLVKSLAAHRLRIEHLDLGDPADGLLELSGHRAVRVHHPSHRTSGLRDLRASA